MSIKVLVADDSITIQKVIGIIFGGDEYSLTVVDNGKAAVDKACEIIPDILLIDALMPGMSGYEVSEAVRATPSLAAKPILLLTGSFEPFDEDKARKCGADDFIAKPFESQQIISKVKELLELGNSRTGSSQVIPSQPVPETVPEVPPTISAPIDTPPPVFDQQPEAVQPQAAADIWGAFTTEEPPGEAAAAETAAPPVEFFAAPAAAFTAPVEAAPSSALVEPDVFAIVSEENDSQLLQSSAAAQTQPDHTGTQWIPVEENTFEFEEDAAAEPLQPSFAEQAAPAQETSFGDISFEDDVTTPAAPAFSAPPEPAYTAPAPVFADFSAPSPVIEETPAVEAPPQFASAPAAETATPAATPPSAALTEEQLKSAIMAASKDVIERIVWEVVPDLAEAMIREAIRKIKDGV